jgi:subtilisin family serine protease
MGIKQFLQDQVEAILKENPGESQNVIVRMLGDRLPDKEVIPAISEAVRRRTFAITARELLPPKAAAIGPADQAPTKNAMRMLAATSKSLVSNVATKIVANLGADDVRTSGLGRLAPLLQSEIVLSSVQAEAEKRPRKATAAQTPHGESDVPPTVTQLWASNSAALTVSRDALPKIADIEDVRDIYLNRRLFVPPLVAPPELPAVVRDNHASAWGLRKIGALATWGAYERRGEDITVAVLDTGIDSNHPDLKGKIAAWAEFDENGKVVQGSRPRDTDQHGTHCAGIICGGRASGRWIGVAPNARVAVALCLDGKRGGTDAQILGALQWAIEQQVDVISMSLGGLTLGPRVPSTYSVLIQNALRVGIPVVTAIGNAGSQTSGSPGNDFFSLAVGATDPDDRPAGFSGGRTHVIEESRFIPNEFLPLAYSKPDLSAPGVAIYSSIPGGKWEAFNGTSMATPHVAGAIALLLSATSIKQKVDPANRAFLIQDLLTGSVDELGEAGQDHRYGFGRLDVLRAIGYALDRGY